MSRRLERAREILRTEGEAVRYAAQRLDENFDQLVDRILHLQGKVVLTGVGKSGLIAQKIAATLASTGTPALFLHSVEAVMGDLGILSPDDLSDGPDQSRRIMHGTDHKGQISTGPLTAR